MPTGDGLSSGCSVVVAIRRWRKGSWCACLVDVEDAGLVEFASNTSPLPGHILGLRRLVADDSFG